MSGHRPDTAQAITARVEQLLSQSARVSPDDVLRLLRRAETRVTLDIEQEIQQLKNRASARSDP